ncbi:B3/B4 domain-containing protein [Natronoflexus pectinivorans]|uniref:DNA/RNA-binding domain of Phe-tRNA-synthetase-like protein n=1 Tax=Natronoflexus pectinivorans TaxID=682526 RepID=A0A4R2GJA2_9BACT|nr:phenylalanine--tRNA ligase beta subunit-related protein [Natronoflexus pectinivorans]TCO08792.1 DNA/RNA-binding domain of Phe-tRNA-synthetase-like protein [Natronoflexus pectinivorans]
MKIIINKQISDAFPAISFGCLTIHTEVKPSGEELVSAMNELCRMLTPDLSPESIRNHPVVAATKNAYRILGKDPNRYRPAAESLLRRLALGKGLYQVNNMVDILNMVSVKSGFSIGGYDADKISGNISFGVGKTDEPYEGIGRGVLNIENLPVFRDEIGAFGTSTSDSVRTMVTENTTRFLLIIPAYNGECEQLENAMEYAERLLAEFGKVKEITIGCQGLK